MAPPLLEAVHSAVADRTPNGDARVERVTVGDRLILVELDAPGAAGVAHRPPGTVGATLEGVAALDVANWATDPPTAEAPLGRSVGVAALNALSAGLIEWATGDPFEALGEAVSTITTVGLFGPAFRKFGPVEVRVIERRDLTVPETPDGVTVELYDPDDAEAAIAGSDVLFVTGSTLLYGGTEAYLAAARDVPDVVLVGATASFVPEPAFDAGATMLAGARVADAETIRGRIATGECATDLHDVGLEKVYVSARATERLELG